MSDIRVQGTPCAHGQQYNFAVSGHPHKETRRYYACNLLGCKAQWQVIQDHTDEWQEVEDGTD